MTISLRGLVCECVCVCASVFMRVCVWTGCKRRGRQTVSRHAVEEQIINQLRLKRKRQPASVLRATSLNPL